MTPDITQLVPAITGFLSPFLPLLMKMPEKAVEEVGKKMGAGAWDTAENLWNKLWPSLKDKPAAREAAEDAAADPKDADALAALRLQLKKLLEADEDLARELADLWEEAKKSGVTVTAPGERSVAIGGKASGNIIITGDKNKVNE